MIVCQNILSWTKLNVPNLFIKYEDMLEDYEKTVKDATRAIGLDKNQLTKTQIENPYVLRSLAFAKLGDKINARIVLTPVSF